MDTRSPTATEIDVEAQVAEIRAHMPETYKSIQAKAAEIGKPAYALVRRALRGEANCFYAIERRRCVGTPVRTEGIDAEAARLMVLYGCSLLVMWGPEAVVGVQTCARASSGATP